MHSIIYTYAIVESDKSAAARLIALMNKPYFKGIDRVGTYHTSKTALAGLKKHLPDLIFMDIFLEDGKTCFDILDELPPDDHRIIFITNSEAHIRQALEYNMVQYINKPVQYTKLKAAVDKAEEMKFRPAEWPVLLKESVYEENVLNRKINLKDVHGSIVRVPISDVLYFKGGGNGNDYTIVYLDRDNPHAHKTLFSKPRHQLKEYHGLPDVFFFGRSCIVNTDKVIGISPKNDAIVFDKNTSLSVKSPTMKQLLQFLRIK